MINQVVAGLAFETGVGASFLPLGKPTKTSYFFFAPFCSVFRKLFPFFSPPKQQTKGKKKPIKNESIQSHFRAVSEQFQCSFRAATEQFLKSSFRADSDQFQSNFRAISEQFSDGKSCNANAD